MRRQTIFTQFINEFVDYCTKTIVFEYNDKTVDFIVKSLNDIKNNGLYLVRDEKALYIKTDTDLVKDYDLQYKDRINNEWFMDEFNNIRYIPDGKYNNTLAGRYGIEINIGNNTILNTYSTPAYYIMYVSSTSNPTERDYVTLIKELRFDVGVAVDCNQLWEPRTNYESIDFFTEYFYELMDEYFRSACPLANRIRQFKDCGFNMIEENEVLVRGIINIGIDYI